ncbi:MAG TPA: lysozyme inhibitor LprI family protein [Gemmatimonadaceae bacterium]|nr:lysozyme inhibitor LprI family protein [Gemmatimonadaceae bacterium]
MITYLPQRLPSIAALLFLAVASCDRTEKTNAAPVATQDTMLLHDLAQANRNTALADMDTTIPVVVRSRPTDGEVQEITGVGGTPANASEILTPSAGTPRAPRRPPATAAPAAPSIGDPCQSPVAADQSTCLYRSIARSDAGLNRVYQELVAQARTSGGSELEERIRQQQRDWVVTRDQECRNQTRSEEGTLWAPARGRCLADQSARRAGELQATLNRLRGQ